MILDAARAGLANLLAPETRAVFWKVLGLTIAALALLWLALRETVVYFATPLVTQLMPSAPDWAGWMTFVIGLLASIGLALALALVLAPVTALIAGLFLDDVAEVIEKRDFPDDPPGRALPFGEALVETLKFLGVVIVGNIVALFLLLIPGVNLVAFFLVNGYLLGREFFEFAAMRHRTPQDARLFRKKHKGRVLAAGLLLSAYLAVPILNLTTPLFAAGLMVHLHKRLSRYEKLLAVAPAPAALRARSA